MKIMLLSVVIANSVFLASLVILTASRLDGDARLFWRLEVMSHDQALVTPSQLHEFATLVHAAARDPNLRLFAQREVQRSELLLRMNAKRLTVPDHEWDTMPFGLLQRWKRATMPLENPYMLYLETKYHTARLICVNKFSFHDGNASMFLGSALAAIASFLLVHLLHGLRLRRLEEFKSVNTLTRDAG